MYATAKILSVFTLTGSVFAAPPVSCVTKVQRHGGGGEWGWGEGGDNSSSPTPPWTNCVATETVLGTAGAPTPPASAASSPSSDLSSAASAPSITAPSSNEGSWQPVVANWRSKGGLGALTPDNQLTANAQKTAEESVGGLKHQLNSGTMAQVLAPGTANDFEHVYVGGWLCEIPSLPGLDGVCAEQSKGWAYEGQTGHAEILTDPSYSKIGCAHSEGTGVWSCDLA